VRLAHSISLITFFLNLCSVWIF
jgi:hypothetical protein